MEKGHRFYKTYEEALGTHMARKSRRATRSWPARRIGKEALAHGLDAIDLARIHNQAIRKLKPDGIAAHITGKCECSLSLDALFLVEALVPLEKARKADQLKLGKVEKRLEKQLQGENRRQSKLLDEAKHQREQVRQLTRQLLLAQEAERKEISRDLHDEIAQVLAGINVRLAALKKVVQIGGEDISERIDQTQKLVEHSVAAVHRYALRLRPSLLDDLGLIPTLRSYIGTLKANSGLAVQFIADGVPDSLSNERSTALYRIAQEALTNVVRHSRASKARVTIQNRAQRIRLEIKDDGHGFDHSRILNSYTFKRLGILGMRERVEMFDGEFSIESTPAKGTTIVAEIPLEPASSKKGKR